MIRPSRIHGHGVLESLSVYYAVEVQEEYAVESQNVVDENVEKRRPSFRFRCQDTCACRRATARKHCQKVCDSSRTFFLRISNFSTL